VIVDFPIERDCSSAIVADDGLIAAAQVDDLQPHGAQRRHAAFKHTLLVRSTM
jgi:hypothetical protein